MSSQESVRAVTEVVGSRSVARLRVQLMERQGDEAAKLSVAACPGLLAVRQRHHHSSGRSTSLCCASAACKRRVSPEPQRRGSAAQP